MEALFHALSKDADMENLSMDSNLYQCARKRQWRGENGGLGSWSYQRWSEPKDPCHYRRTGQPSGVPSLGLK